MVVNMPSSMSQPNLQFQSHPLQVRWNSNNHASATFPILAHLHSSNVGMYSTILILQVGLEPVAAESVSPMDGLHMMNSLEDKSVATSSTHRFV